MVDTVGTVPLHKRRNDAGNPPYHRLRDMVEDALRTGRLSPRPSFLTKEVEMTSETLPVHEAALLIPEMDDESYRELLDDIREHGLQQPILLHDGHIVDGRHRYRACRELDIEPWTTDWNSDESVVDFVVSLNIKRRHLTAGQRSTIAVDMLPLLQAEATKRMLKGHAFDPDQEALDKSLSSAGESGTDDPPQRFAEGQKGEAVEVAARAAGTNRTYVREARNVKGESPEAFDMLRSGRVSMPEAKEVARLPEPVRRRVVERAKAEPHTKVTSIVRDVKKAQRDDVAARSEEFLSGLPDPDGRLARNQRADELFPSVGKLVDAIGNLNVDECLMVFEGNELEFFKNTVGRVQHWADKAEKRIKTPIRLVSGGSNGA